MTEAKTASPLESVVHSIAWMQRLGGEPSMEHPLVKRIFAGAQRLLAHRTSKKEPITVFQLLLEQLVPFDNLYHAREFFTRSNAKMKRSRDIRVDNMLRPGAKACR